MPNRRRCRSLRGPHCPKLPAPGPEPRICIFSGGTDFLGGWTDIPSSQHCFWNTWQCATVDVCLISGLSIERSATWLRGHRRPTCMDDMSLCGSSEPPSELGETLWGNLMGGSGSSVVSTTPEFPKCQLASSLVNRSECACRSAITRRNSRDFTAAVIAPTFLSLASHLSHLFPLLVCDCCIQWPPDIKCLRQFDRIVAVSDRIEEQSTKAQTPRPRAMGSLALSVQTTRTIGHRPFRNGRLPEPWGFEILITLPVSFPSPVPPRVPKPRPHVTAHVLRTNPQRRSRSSSHRAFSTREESMSRSR